MTLIISCSVTYNLNSSRPDCAYIRQETWTSLVGARPLSKSELKRIILIYRKNCNEVYIQITNGTYFFQNKANLFKSVRDGDILLVHKLPSLRRKYLNLYHVACKLSSILSRVCCREFFYLCSQPREANGWALSLISGHVTSCR